MKDLFIAFATVAALFSFAACKSEENPKDDGTGHIEFRSGLNYSKDVLENFDAVYDIVSDGKSVASGTMLGEELKPIIVKSGIKEGTFDVHISFKAKSSFYESWDLWKEYVIDIDSFIALYSVGKNGSESELIKIGYDLKGATFGTFVESKIPEVIALMEEALAVNETLTIRKDETGKYIVIY